MGTHPIFESDFDCLTGTKNLDKMDEAFVKKRLEKDLEDLKKMIALHFEQRKKDEEELEELKSRIDKRKQMRLRAERERERQEYERLEKERKAAEEAARKAEEEQKKKDAMAALSSNSGYKSQAKQRTGKADRERKKKVLAERRKPLNIDHCGADKIKEKIDEMYKYLCQLETEKCELEVQADPAKHEVTIMRARVNMVMQRNSKRKK